MGQAGLRSAKLPCAARCSVLPVQKISWGIDGAWPFADSKAKPYSNNHAKKGNERPTLIKPQDHSTVHDRVAVHVT